MNHEPKIIELLDQTRNAIAVPSREEVRSWMHSVTESAQMRYTVRETPRLRSWYRAINRMISGHKALFITGLSLAAVILVIVPISLSVPTASVSDDAIVLEQEQEHELLVIDQEDALIDAAVIGYLNQLISH